MRSSENLADSDVALSLLLTQTLALDGTGYFLRRIQGCFDFAARASDLIIESLIEDLVGCRSAGCTVHSEGTCNCKVPLSVGKDYCRGAGQKGRVGFRFEKLQA